jgi:hypothetical protein
MVKRGWVSDPFLLLIPRGSCLKKTHSSKNLSNQPSISEYPVPAGASHFCIKRKRWETVAYGKADPKAARDLSTVLPII